MAKYPDKTPGEYEATSLPGMEAFGFHSKVNGSTA
jgi:hypothetical protein